VLLFGSFLQIVLGMLQLGSHAELHDWQANFEIATKRDHNEILQKMAVIQTLNESSNGKLDIQADMLLEIMTLLQDVS
jgi:hypothetical protein